MSTYVTTHHHGSAPVTPRACPACGGLECLDRPRYFAGQLITEAELNGDQAYVVAKNRLHNRYLHGAGVVCGLEVVCDDCDGWVRVQPGYAIDPCGNDIVVCRDEPLNVLELIARCRDHGTRSDCDPLRTGDDPDCDGRVEHWCVTVKYEEREARASTVLRRGSVSTPACSCGGACGCGHGNGNGHANGADTCSCGGSVGIAYQMPTGTAYSSRTAAEARSRTVGACEPTRIVEGYRLDVCEGEAGLCRKPLDALRESALWEVIGCFYYLYPFFRRKVPQKAWTPIVGSFFARDIEGSPQDLYESYSYFRQALYELDAKDPFRVRCSMRKGLDVIALQKPDVSALENDTTYARQAYGAFQQLGTVGIQYALDCICAKLLPKCPPDPPDDRLILGCLTVVDGKIVNICNFGCRKHAGAWPTLYRWTTFVPLLPLLGVLIEWLCCQPLYDPRWQTSKVMKALRSTDPSYRRSALADDDFRAVRDVGDRFAKLRENMSTSNMATFASDPSSFATILRSVFRRDDGPDR